MVMRKLREKFTKWYIERGYTFYYEIPPLGTIDRCAIWDCPWWVRPLLIFFSPSVYYIECISNICAENMWQGIETTSERCIELVDTIVEEQYELSVKEKNDDRIQTDTDNQ